MIVFLVLVTFDFSWLLGLVDDRYCAADEQRDRQGSVLWVRGLA